MNAGTLNLQQLFQKDVRYEIPQFQRPYVWGKETQWLPLWEDIQNAAEEWLDTGSGKAHFMGAVVLQQRPNPAYGVETRIVVDGQQRLTTMQLLLDAVQEIFQQRGYNRPAQRLHLMVENNRVFWEDNHDLTFKIWPTVFDREAFRHAMHNELPSSEYEGSRVVQAHDFFKDQVNSWLDGFPNEGKSPDDAAEALEYAAGRLLEMVVIDLSDSDDPHVIFETLNARGTPLLQSDLVKNLIMHKSGLGADGDSPEASQLWGFDNDWWREEVTQGRLRYPRIDAFLNYWLVSRKRKEITNSSVFTEFSEYADTLEEEIPAKSIHEVAADIGKVGEIYRELEEGHRPEIATFLDRWRTMQAGVLTPVLLWLFSSDVPSEQIAKGLRALESYLVRRMICRITTKDYNQLFVALLGRLEEHGAQCAGDTILRFLGEQTAHVREWPDDRKLRDEFLSAPLYRLLTRGRLRLVLEGIESGLRSNLAETQAVPTNLTIEHVMPQGWRSNWRLPTDRDDVVRDRLIHSMGNLTLVTGRLNARLGNYSWEQKRQRFQTFSTLYLNKDLLDNAQDVWDEAMIAERARRLCQAAIKVWPHANGI